MPIINGVTRRILPKEYYSFYGTDQFYNRDSNTLNQITYNNEDSIYEFEVGSDLDDKKLSCIGYYIYGYRVIYPLSLSTITSLTPSVSNLYTIYYINGSKKTVDGKEKYKFSISTTNVSNFSGNRKEHRFRNPMANCSFTATNGSYYFDFSDGVTYSNTYISCFQQGTGTKNTYTYNLYLDHTEMKNAFAAKANEYTTINLYHLDGTAWS